MDARRFTLLTATGIGNSSSRYALRRAAGRGRLLRIRQGVYISAVDWQQARAWERYRISAAAIAIQTPDTIFCRQTALTLRELPLLSVPREIFRRTVHKSQVGRLDAEELADGSRFWPVRWVQVPVPRGMSRQDADAAYSDGSLAVPVEALELKDVLDAAGEPVRVRLEGLSLAVADTMRSLSSEESVVVMDAVLAGRYAGAVNSDWTSGMKVSQLDSGADFLRSAAQRQQWRWIKEFGSSRSESPGESRSRALMHQLGFAIPDLQVSVRLSGGRVVRPDFHWPGTGVIGEFDGRVKYSRAQDLAGIDANELLYQEKLREDQLRSLGYRMVRWGWTELNDPDRFAQLLLSAGVPRATW